MTARDRNRFIIAMGMALLIGVVMSTAFIFKFIPGIDGMQTLYDDVVHFQTKANAGVDDPISATKTVLVEIDEKSVQALSEQYGRVFSWPRTLHGIVISNLSNANARVIVFDILFDGPSDEDQQFAQAIKDSGRVIIPQAGYPPIEGGLEEGQIPTYEDAIKPRPGFIQAAMAVAHPHAVPDPDGSVRSVPLLADMKGTEIPAMSLLAASKYLRRPIPVEDRGDGFILTAGRPIPVDSHGRMIVNYLGKPSHRPEVIGAGPVQTVSFVDVLNGEFDTDLVKDKIVYIGLTALGFADDFQVPTSVGGLKMAGVEIHVHATETILQGTFLERQDTVTTLLVIMGLTLVTGFLLALFSPIRAAVFVLLLFFAYLVAGILFMVFFEGAQAQARISPMLNAIHPSVALLLTFITVMLYRIVFEQAEQRATKKAMGQYVSPAVMDEVMDDPDAIGLGGRKLDLTVLFSDIRGFTSISEKMDPQDLVAFLNEYLTAMTDVVYQYEGVLDKYMGDAVMAFWGAPLEVEDHAERAANTAVDMMRRLAELREDWIARGVPPMDIGIGLNTGPMTVGNVGGMQRFDYTVMGDAVNLGSRLEGVNKQYGTNIIISEGTFDVIKEKFRCRYLDLIAVKGKKEPVTIYELVEPLPEGFGVAPSPLTMPEEAVKELVAVGVAAASANGDGTAAGDGDGAALALAERPQLPSTEGFGISPELVWAFEEAVVLYLNREFEAARTKFEQVRDERGEDVACDEYIHRCDVFMEEAPEAEWDGVWVMTTK